VDIATHAVASFALARGFFPRRPRATILAMVVAGTLADVDLVTELFGPTAYFFGRHTYTHSIVGLLLIVAVSAAIAYFYGGRKKEQLITILGSVSLAAALHLALDFCGSDGIAVLWPFHARRFALDWLPGVGAWILGLLLAGILLPELFRLVGSEIGAKDKTPRGRNGALIAMVLVAGYIAARGVLHSSAINLLDAHTYHSEIAQRSGAFATTASPVVWRGVVETQSNLCVLTVPVLGAVGFDPEASVCWHKPEDSPALAAAQNTGAVIKFLKATQFPRAGLTHLDSSTLVVLRDMRDEAQAQTSHRIAVVVSLDAKSQVQSATFVWADELPLR
jgi:membrane-bound metal-dependent hydrolase YbcI (DUF457 family)